MPCASPRRFLGFGFFAEPALPVPQAEMDTEACHSVPDLRLLFAADSAPTHVRVFLEPAYESSNSSDAPPARSFFSPPLPFTPPAFDSPAAGNQPQASSVIPPVNVVVSEPVASSSSASSSSAASSSLSSSLPRLFVSSTVPRAAESQLPVSDLSPVSMRTPPSPSAGAYGGRDGRESARISPSAGRRKGEGSLGLAVPPGCGVGSQARFRDLMAADKGRLAACTAEGAPRRVSLEELSKHCTREDLWVALDGAVYDISSYVSFHPGGARILVDHAGTDISEVFRRYHAWVNAKHILEYNQVGVFEG
ncbi:hypothetical protein NCLIV_056850 [Neospora caninum Liverpool]|uniref:Cytochrome b5 heme-binding domain-containing protein n=1 Tax=Neospora caninum (strain Liverpool) TaxID=572307 RepID=F0VNG5_NEOCL|nr:hypothetical protein NCLIV_056850 [Neospora caninum Liverpool]CBZ55261.1 hypothetical protein NCLIV_056850 [Neospora caninum Liverpool]|eukprot:XP_003885289.1 hypothetical protein NCLIV_056850 [Neospora caninum Liverpool]